MKSVIASILNEGERHGRRKETRKPENKMLMSFVT